MKHAMIVLLILVFALNGQVPLTLSYQGILTDNSGTIVPDGSYDLTFNLYDVESGGSTLWAETQTLQISGGIINVVLGKIIPLNLPFNTGYWLGITVDSGSEMVPRIELTSSAYSLKAQAVVDSSVSGASLANNEIVRSVNQLKDDITISGGDNINITVSNDTLIISTVGLSSGLWNQNGSDIYFNGGSVGIGTTTPGLLLDVRGPGVDDGVLMGISNSDLSHFLHIFPGRQNDPNPYFMVQSGDPIRFATNAGGFYELMRLTGEGNLGIGTTTPTTKLEVADTIYSSAGGFKFPDGSVQATAASGSGSGNTLDQAYDEGGAGAGRTITADAGAFEVNGVDGALFSGTFNSGLIPAEGAGTRMMWYPAKASFRAGRVTGDTFWDDDSIGRFSFATGYNTRASGTYSTALGNGTKATGNTATAFGVQSSATGNTATAMGWHTEAIGDFSITMGYQASAMGLASTALGSGTTASGNYSTSLGGGTTASGSWSTAMGAGIEAAGQYSFAVALNSQTGTVVSQNNTMSVMGGYVGIGTTTPTTTLEVADTIYASAGGFKFPDGSVQSTAASGGSGDITGVIAGTGLSGGGLSGDVTIDAQFAGTGVANTIARSDHNHNASYVNEGQSNSITSTMIVNGTVNVSDIQDGATLAEISDDDGPGSGLNADYLDNLHASSFMSASTDNWVNTTGDVMTGRLTVNSNNGTIFSGSIGSGTIPATGSGTRMMWYPRRAALRSGYVYSNQWDDSNIGNYSVAMGHTTIALGTAATAFGQDTESTGDYSFTAGYYAEASGYGSAAIGYNNHATGNYSTAIGNINNAQSYASLALGRLNVDSGSPGSWVPQELVLSIGDGSAAARSNSLTFSKNGYMWIQGTLTQNSDQNLKQNIQPLNNAIQNLQQINGVTYQWKNTEQMGPQTEIGVIAQDVEKVYPELVGENEGSKTTNYIGLVPVLIEAVKEQQKMIQQLQKRIAELENN